MSTETIYAKSVKVKVTDEDDALYISIAGTDDIMDIIDVTLDSKVCANGYHRGCMKIAWNIWEQLNNVGSKHIKIKGHSMGAAIAECLHHLLSNSLFDVPPASISCICYGGYGVTKNPDTAITRVCSGRDIVPKLFGWKYKNPITNFIAGDPDGKWPTRFITDHGNYPWSSYELDKK